MPDVKEISARNISCQQCSLNALCLPQSLSDDEMRELDEVIRRKSAFQRNQLIHLEGQPFKSIYAVRSGSVKTYCVDEEGEEQVVGFFLPGEIFGLDGIEGSKYASSASALELTSVCEIPFSHVEKLSSRISSLQSHMYRLLSREIREDQQLQLLLGKKTAEERIGTFLLNLSARYRKRNLSPDSFRLPMARADIANYLGLAVETVSRVFTRLQKNEVLEVVSKDVKILKPHELCATAHHLT